MTSAFENISDISYFVAVIFCISCNILLLYLVYTKSPRHVGTYKYLMTFFAVNGILHSIFDFITKPIFLMLEGNEIHGNILVYFVRNDRFPSKWWAILATEIYGFFLAVIFVIFAVHFIFRYWTITKNPKIRFFDFPYFVFWIIGSYYFGLEYSYILHVEFSERPDKTEIIKPKMLSDFGYSMDNITYMAARFVKFSEEQNQLIIDWRQVGFYFAAVKTMILSLIILTFCGISIMKTIRKDLESLQSKEKIKLELNLFLALIVQTIIPIVVIYCPFLLMWNFPIFLGIETARLTGIGVALYPGIDPLAIMFIVANYRRAVLNPFRRIVLRQNVVSYTVRDISSMSRSGSKIGPTN
ncbi:Protein CBR-STR-77 [Caenorhabditis briggsae]|uniref:Protein CBR-STR-77 n=2 Tax=Caenorhabditis briggsae TaxID=6238 RepID=A8X0F5_CAEBR|nr:Protein CBR-STR-77 [Caenorhabditis briggsae]CAP26115.2 Protein CBR-STR-77 [Caenorhabditis briggsae]